MHLHFSWQELRWACLGEFFFFYFWQNCRKSVQSNYSSWLELWRNPLNAPSFLLITKLWQQPIWWCSFSIWSTSTLHCFGRLKIASARVSQARIKVNRFDAFARIEVSLFGCIRLLLIFGKSVQSNFSSWLQFWRTPFNAPSFPFWVEIKRWNKKGMRSLLYPNLREQLASGQIGNGGTKIQKLPSRTECLVFVHLEGMSLSESNLSCKGACYPT